MKRTASRALVAALVTALALSGAALAKGHPSHGPKADQGTTTGQPEDEGKRLASGRRLPRPCHRQGGTRGSPGDGRRDRPFRIW